MEKQSINLIKREAREKNGGGGMESRTWRENLGNDDWWKNQKVIRLAENGEPGGPTP